VHAKVAYVDRHDNVASTNVDGNKTWLRRPVGRRSKQNSLCFRFIQKYGARRQPYFHVHDTAGYPVGCHVFAQWSSLFRSDWNVKWSAGVCITRLSSNLRRRTCRTVRLCCCYRFLSTRLVEYKAWYHVPHGLRPELSIIKFLPMIDMNLRFLEILYAFTPRSNS